MMKFHTIPLIRKTLFIAMLITSGTVFAGAVKGVAPDFTLKSLDGKNIKLSEHRGSVVMVNFWASWCGPCRQEMPILEQLYKRYQDLGFVILGVNTDENPANSRILLKDISVTFPVLFDSKNNIVKKYDVQAMPTTYLIDRNGNLRYVHKGYKPGYEVKYAQQIKALIRE